MGETKTKIVATLGPASWEEPVLSELLRTGVDVCRINCSHADHAGIRRQVARVRRAAMQIGQPVAILLDLQGPKIRTGPSKTPIQLAKGDVLTVKMDPKYQAHDHTVGTTYPEMAGDVSPGVEVLFADGLLAGTVVAVRRELEPAEVDIQMTVGGPLGSHKGINLPNVEMSVPALTEKDLADLEVGLEVGVDYVAHSFVQRGRDVQQLIDAMERLGKRVPIIAKIETPTAVEYLHEILEVSEGVMVARGDLGVEVKLEKVPVYQKRIIAEAFTRGKIVITATQMLDSMERNPRPTRAETTDVANAILDGTDAVMLSGETATGLWPIEAVRVMDTIAREVEGSRFFRVTARDAMPRGDDAHSTILRAACFAAQDGDRPLVVFSWSGASAIYASKARMRTPIYALTPKQNVVDELALVWGITSVLVPPVRSVDDLLASGEQLLLSRGLVEPGQEVVMVVGQSPMEAASRLMKIHVIGR